MDRRFGSYGASKAALATQRGSHSSVGSLIYAIEDFIRTHNQNPKPPHWQKTSDEILAAIARFASRTLQAHA
jgi:hypothetical protein